MAEAISVADRMEDHALESVPTDQRQNWLQLTWGTAGIVTTLIQLFIGALVTFVAGLWLGIAAAVLVTIIGALLGWASGHVAYRTGLSSSIMARKHGFGVQGSVLLSIVFGFMIIGFLALENALLYKGFLFYFGLEATTLNAIVIYGILTVAWIFLTAFGFQLVALVSSWLLIAFLAVLLYMLVNVVIASEQSFGDVISYGAQFPPEVLAAMGASTTAGKFIFAVNVLIGSAGALALVDADLGRYARKSSDIAIAALLGNIAMDIVMFVVGGIVMYAGMQQVVDYYINVDGLSVAAAHQAALQSPDSIAAAFVIFGGIIGTILMIFAQAKAQVLNTYSSALSLTSFFQALFAWKPGRVAFVVLANILGLVLIASDILGWVQAYLTLMGVWTTGCVGVIVADYFFVSRKLGTRDADMESLPAVNWSGIIAVVGSFIIAHYVLKGIIPIEFFTSFPAAVILYCILRLGSRGKL